MYPLAVIEPVMHPISDVSRPALCHASVWVSNIGQWFNWIIASIVVAWWRGTDIVPQSTYYFSSISCVVKNGQNLRLVGMTKVGNVHGVWASMILNAHA